jgi:hypothetical protein
MNEILQSKFFADLKAGKLPEVQVALTKESLFGVSASLLIVGLILILAHKISQSI